MKLEANLPKKTKNIPKPTYFGKNLKFLRRLKGLSQTELAGHLGLNRHNLASYESGMVEPKTSVFIAVSEYFEVDGKDLLGKVLSEKPIEVTGVVSEPKDELDKYLKDQMQAFTKQTNEMTKIYEGYRTLSDMRKDDESIIKDPLHETMDDLLEILNKLIGVNWELIQSVYATDENPTS